MKLNGCHNTKRKDSYAAPDRRYLLHGSFVMVCKFITDTMSKDCKYDRRDTDTGCKGCTK